MIGISLSMLKFLFQRIDENLVLGHGRSVTIMCALLVVLGLAEDWKTAEKMIKAQRPWIHLNALHRKALEEWSKRRLPPPHHKNGGSMQAR